MKVLTIRNVPDDLYAILARRARLHRRSLQQEVLAVLERARVLEGEPPTARAQMIRHRLSARQLGDTVQEVRQERDR